MTQPHFKNRKEALVWLEAHARDCVLWWEKGVEMSAIYWCGKRCIQRADQPVNVPR